jgi:hypothetical protein
MKYTPTMPNRCEGAIRDAQAFPLPFAGARPAAMEAVCQEYP